MKRTDLTQSILDLTQDLEVLENRALVLEKSLAVVELELEELQEILKTSRVPRREEGLLIVQKLLARLEALHNREDEIVFQLPPFQVKGDYLAE